MKIQLLQKELALAGQALDTRQKKRGDLQNEVAPVLHVHTFSCVVLMQRDCVCILNRIFLAVLDFSNLETHRI